MKAVKFFPFLFLLAGFFLVACSQMPDVLPTLPPITLPVPTANAITGQQTAATVAPFPSATTTPNTPFAITPVTTATLTFTPVTLTVAPTVCGVPFGWVAYMVQPGDTVDELARRTGVTLWQIQQANCLPNINLIYRGQSLYVPFIPVTFTPVPTVISAALNTPPPPDPTDPRVDVLPNSGTPGMAFNIAVAHVTPTATIQLEIVFRFAVVYSDSALADAEGQYLFIYQSPANVSPGTYTVRVLTSTGEFLTGQFVITAE